MKTYAGGCHCGLVRFEVEMELDKAITCNCSHCHMKGLVLTFVPTAQFKLLSGEDSLAEYLFNTKKIVHRFCKVCGVQPFAQNADMDMVAINLRAVADIDLDSLSIEAVNGKDF